jgi:hypothetical protein
MKQNIENSIMYGCLTISLIAVILVGFIYTKSMFNENKVQSTQFQVPNKAMVVKFTEFDKSKAIEFMDKNNDGMCDFCGMRIEDCMASGMMQCTMDPNSKVGLLKGDHYHVNLKIYQNGKEIILNDPKYFVRSSFVHVENDGPEKAGNIVHFHSTGIDLKYFLDSLNIQLDKTKVYVNNNLNNEGLLYVTKNGDRILITDSVNQDEINKQLKTITSFSFK